MNLSCSNCEQQIVAQLTDVPRAWANQLAKAICSSSTNTSSIVSCSDVKDCETLTSLSPFSKQDTNLCITYKDEHSIEVTRCIDMSTFHPPAINITGLAFTGNTTKTLTINLSDGSQVTGNFTDNNTYTLAQNGIGPVAPGSSTIELGGVGAASFIHNTTLDINYYYLNLVSTFIFDYGIQAQNNADWLNGTGIMSWWRRGKQFTDGVPVPPNLVRIGFNYTEEQYATANEANLAGQGLFPIPGYFGDGSAGYFLSTNLTGHGAFGQYVDSVDSKGTGIFFHTRDTVKTDGVSIFAVPTSAYSGTALNIGQMGNYKVAIFHTDKTVQFNGYPSTRDDGANTSNKFFYPDINGKLKLGTPQGASGTFLSQDGKTVTVANGIVTSIV